VNDVLFFGKIIMTGWSFCLIHLMGR